MLRRLALLVLVLSLPTPSFAQATHVSTSGTLPSSCRVGDVYYKTGASAGLYNCTATNTWTLVDAGSGGGTVTNTGTLTSNALIAGNGSADIKVATAAANSKLLGSGASGSGSAYSELTLGTNLSMSGTTLNATGGGGGGGLTLLEQHTASTSADLQFTSCISSTYDDYQIEIVGLQPATNNVALILEFSSDGGSTWNTTNNYYSWWAGLSNTTAIFSGAANPAAYWLLAAGLTNTSARTFRATLNLSNLLSTTSDKQGGGVIVFSNQTVVGSATWGGWFTVPGTAFNALRIRADSGDLAIGTARCYGLEK